MYIYENVNAINVPLKIRKYKFVATIMIIIINFGNTKPHHSSGKLDI